MFNKGIFDIKNHKTEGLLYEELKNDEKILIQWHRENPISVYIEIPFKKMFNLRIITEDVYRKYQSEVAETADVLKESCQKYR